MKKYHNIFGIIWFIIFLTMINSCKENSTEPSYDSDKIEAAFSQAGQLSNIKSLVVSLDGKIIKEAYWHGGGAEVQHDVRSVTKSVIDILVGIAIDMDYIKSVDDPIKNYLADLVENFPIDKAGITIKHLLTMSGGFQWEELVNASQYSTWFNSANQVNYILNTQLKNNPGQTFTYNSAALHLLSVILTRATQMSTKQFAQQFLFNPIGIGERTWQTDHQGFFNGGAGLQLTPLDMIKIGNLMLNNGEYQGKRIVSADWIYRSTQFQMNTNNVMAFGPSYGYCWWLGKSDNNSYAYANGWGGQFIVVVPNLNLVVTATNQWSGVSTTVADDQWYKTISIIMNSIVTAVKE